MTNIEIIVEKLSQFNNLSFTKKQWETIFKGCGCPKSHYFWASVKKNNMHNAEKLYLLVDININTFKIIWEEYCTNNRKSVKEAYDKKKAYKKARAKAEAVKNKTFFMLNGVILTEKPERF